MTGPHFTPLAQSLPATVPFVGPETQERARGRPFRARLGANESAFGPSPAAQAAIAAAAAGAWMYGDPEAWDLRQAIAAHHGTTPAHVLAGEGIDGILGLLVRLMIGPGDRAVTSDGAYPTFAYHVAGFGGQLVRVPYRGHHEDPAALCAKAAEVGAKLLYLANPDNPLGSWHSGSDISALLDHLPPGTLLVLDEAYVDLAPAEAVPDLAAEDPRVIRLRTFSKGYGLAGLRVGYALGAPELIAAFDKVRNHFGLGRIAQAGALAALQDQAWLGQVRQAVQAGRDALGDIARQNGLIPLPSATNFVAIDCGGTGDFARTVLRELLARDIFVRMPGVAPLDRCIRVSIGDAAAIDAFGAALPDALRAARGG